MAKKKEDTEENMEEMDEKKLEDFVLRNEEKIMEILMTGRSKAESKLREEKEKGKAIVKGIVEAVTDREVTEHFLTMGLEFMLGVGALVKALPWPDELKPFVDMVSDQKDALSTVMCRNNAKCGAGKIEATIEKIELD